MMTEIIRAIKPRAKLMALFGSQGWGRSAVKMMMERLQQSGFEILKTLEVRVKPKKEDLEKAVSFGKHLAQIIKQRTKT
jgi:flavorubredoxin